MSNSSSPPPSPLPSPLDSPVLNSSENDLLRPSKPLVEMNQQELEDFNKILRSNIESYATLVSTIRVKAKKESTAKAAKLAEEYQ